MKGHAPANYTAIPKGRDVNEWSSWKVVTSAEKKNGTKGAVVMFPDARVWAMSALVT